jgi:flagellar protein FliO/FliZ
MDAPEILRVLFGFVAVLGMIGAAAWAARKAGLASLAGVAGKKRRLAVSEMLPLDARRRAVLIRCDDAEYLVILGPTGETLVASGIEAPPLEETAPAVQPANPLAGLGALAERLRQANMTGARKDAA